MQCICVVLNSHAYDSLDGVLLGEVCYMPKDVHFVNTTVLMHNAAIAIRLQNDLLNLAIQLPRYICESVYTPKNHVCPHCCCCCCCLQRLHKSSLPQKFTCHPSCRAIGPSSWHMYKSVIYLTLLFRILATSGCVAGAILSSTRALAPP